MRYIIEQSETQENLFIAWNYQVIMYVMIFRNATCSLHYLDLYNVYIHLYIYQLYEFKRLADFCFPIKYEVVYYTHSLVQKSKQID